jgi:predicted nucleic acid-binding protein
MPDVLVDSSVLLDVLTEDERWFDWSSEALARAADMGEIAINPIIYAETSVRFRRIEDLDDALGTDFDRRPLPWSAAFLAGKSFVAYRRRGGIRASPLPDFYIGAHAAVEKLVLLTRDARRYREYFPTVSLLTPSTGSR